MTAEDTHQHLNPCCGRTLPHCCPQPLWNTPCASDPMPQTGEIKVQPLCPTLKSSSSMMPPLPLITLNHSVTTTASSGSPLSPLCSPKFRLPSSHTYLHICPYLSPPFSLHLLRGSRGQLLVNSPCAEIWQGPSPYSLQSLLEITLQGMHCRFLKAWPGVASHLWHLHFKCTSASQEKALLPGEGRSHVLPSVLRF